MLDTNVLFSCLVYPSKGSLKFLRLLEKNVKIFLPDYVVDELLKVVERKRPDKLEIVKNTFKRFHHTLVKTPEDYTDVPNIRDEKDKPILAAAIKSDVDYLITGDKDFLVLKDIIKKPKIFTMQEFIEMFS